MPLVNGKYQAPNWKNGQAPAIDAAELQAICDRLQALDNSTASPILEFDETKIETVASSGKRIELLAPLMPYFKAVECSAYLQLLETLSVAPNYQLEFVNSYNNAVKINYYRDGQTVANNVDAIVLPGGPRRNGERLSINWGWNDVSTSGVITKLDYWAQNNGGFIKSTFYIWCDSLIQRVYLKNYNGATKVAGRMARLGVLET